jgi:hypothetical protein
MSSQTTPASDMEFDKPINRAVDIDNVFDHLKWNEEVGRWESDKE